MSKFVFRMPEIRRHAFGKFERLSAIANVCAPVGQHPPTYLTRRNCVMIQVVVYCLHCPMGPGSPDSL